MDETKLKKQLQELAKKVGAQSVCIALQSEGLSPRTAEMLLAGDHKGKFRRRTVTAVQAVLAQDGKARAS